MRLIHVKEQRGDRLALRTTWAWELLVLGVGHVAVGLWIIVPGLVYLDALPAFVAAVLPATTTTLSRAVLEALFGAVFLGGGAALLYVWAVGASEAIDLDRRTGLLRTVRIARGRRVVTRRPLHLLKRVDVQREAGAARYALVFEVRGEPPLLFPAAGDAEVPEEGDALVARLRGFLAGRDQ